MIPTPAFKKLSQEKKNEKTKGDSLKEESPCKKLTEKRGIPVLKSRVKSKNDMQGTYSCNFRIHQIRSNSCCIKKKTFLGVEASCSQTYSHNYHSKEEEDFPINYSLKYSETGTYSRNQSSEENLKEKENFETYPDYAETDLDQPTDFSLKYGEETSSDEELKNQAFNYFEGDKTKESGYYSGQPESEDTTRTYYTEGTPYEGTPYNYSMSDLRIDQGESRENAGETFQGEKGMI